MPPRIKYAAGQTVGDFSILGPAEPKNGFARWDVKCTACGKEATVRSTALSAGGRCACAGQVQVSQPINSQPRVDSNLTERLAALEAAVAELKARLDAMSTPASPTPPKTSGIKNYSMRSPQPAVEPRPEPERKQLSISDVLKAAGAVTAEEHRAALEASWARAWELARKTDRTPEETCELHERRNVERDYREGHEPDPERLAARRLEFNDQRMCLDRRGPYQPPLED